MAFELRRTRRLTGDDDPLKSSQFMLFLNVSLIVGFVFLAALSEYPVGVMVLAVIGTVVYLPTVILSYLCCLTCAYCAWTLCQVCMRPFGFPSRLSAMIAAIPTLSGGLLGIWMARMIAVAAPSEHQSNIVLLITDLLFWIFVFKGPLIAGLVGSDD